MGMIILNSIGPKGEELALEAGRLTEIAVGIDPEFNSATFDADGYEEGELQGIVFDALAGLDPEWQSHLQLAD
ncbi:MAG: hypothetical protein ACHQCI_02370 [Solirubrobacterales bacterium]